MTMAPHHPAPPGLRITARSRGRQRGSPARSHSAHPSSAPSCRAKNIKLDPQTEENRTQQQFTPAVSFVTHTHTHNTTHTRARTRAPGRRGERPGYRAPLSRCITLVSKTLLVQDESSLPIAAWAKRKEREYGEGKSCAGGKRESKTAVAVGWRGRGEYPSHMFAYREVVPWS